MMRGCPATGRLMHQFDPATHRCKCGRWERGFKPKTEPTKPRDECQICARKQALNANGRMVHHGYTRPGHGYILGDCFGVNHLPYPATDALKKFLVYLDNHKARLENRLSELPLLEVIDYHYTTYVALGRKREHHSVEVKKGATYCYNSELRQSIPDFDSLIRAEESKLQFELGQVNTEIARVEKRIKDATKVKQ